MAITKFGGYKLLGHGIRRANKIEVTHYESPRPLSKRARQRERGKKKANQ